MKILSLLTVVAVIAAPSFAEDVRQAKSHEHGVGQLDIAFEGTKISMELHAPGADIVGFEYAPKSEADLEKIDAAIAKLAKPLDLVGLPVGAGCTVLEATAELEGDDEHGEGHKEVGEEESHTEFHAEYLFECAELNAVTLTEITFPYFGTFPNAIELELQVISEKGATAFEVERDAPSVNLSGLF